MQENNSSTNAILVILIVVIVGFAVWFFATRYRQAPTPAPANNSLDINLTGSTPAPASTPATY